MGRQLPVEERRESRSRNRGGVIADRAGTLGIDIHSSLAAACLETAERTEGMRERRVDGRSSYVAPQTRILESLRGCFQVEKGQSGARERAVLCRECVVVWQENERCEVCNECPQRTCQV